MDGHSGGGPGRRELRIAPVMTGGTSLSIWMGGVTAELYLLLAAGTRQQTAPPAKDEPSTVAMYRDLLAFVDLEPRIDVVTGTSAGGLNGTLLGAAWCCRVPPDTFLELRETWLGLADLKELLRKPTEVDPPSLLKGDAYFRAEIEKVLSDWRDHAPGWRAKAYEQANADHRTGEPFRELVEHPLDLLITVTTVDPEARSRRDDYGEVISDVNHAHRLRFDQTHIVADDTSWPKKLAIASRTSACIPGVFEPSFLPCGDADAKASGLPDFERHASFRRSHFAVDGGVVVNLPLKEALERVFFQSADAPVRRVVLFVQPTPSVTGGPPATHTVPPTIRESLATIVSAPRAESITEDVDRIDQHNRAVGRQASVRRSLHTIVGDDLVAQATKVMETYREQRADASVRFTADSIARAIDRREIERHDLERTLRPARLELIPTSIEAIGTSTSRMLWAWGLAPIEHAAAMVLGLIRQAPKPVQAQLLGEWRAVNDVVGDIRTIRELDRLHWAAELEQLPVDEARRLDDERASEWARAAYQAWPALAKDADRGVDLGGATGTQRSSLVRQHHLRRLRSSFAAIAAQLAESATKMRSTDLAGRLPVELQADLDVLAPPGVTGRALETRLRAIHVLQSVLLGDVVAREQHIELQVVSWNARDHLTDRRSDEKLAGPELARLGAFLKRSWRANDWCWGRLDGASRLTDLLLDRDHLHDLLNEPGCAVTVCRFVKSSAFDFSPDERKQLIHWLKRIRFGQPKRDIYPTEAAYDWAKREWSSAHPALIALVASRLQLAVAREELPNVATAVRHSIATEQSNELNGAEFERLSTTMPGDASTWTDQQTKRLLGRMRVGEESVGSELGYGLLNRTVSRGSAVAVNALSGERAGIPGLAKVIAPLRTPLHTVNSVVATATSGSPLHRFLTVFAFAIGGSLVGLELAGVEVATPLLVAAEVLIGAAMVAALLRSGFWRFTPFLLVILAILGLAIVGDELSEVVYSLPADDDTIEITEGAVLEFADDGTFELTATVDGEQVSTEYAVAGATLTMDERDAELTVPKTNEFVAPWKTRLFLEGNWLRWILFAVTMVMLAVLFESVGAARSARKRAGGDGLTKRQFAGAAAGTLALGSIALFFAVPRLYRPPFEWLLKGRPESCDGGPDDCHVSRVKDVVVDVATALGEYRVEIVVITMIVAAIMLGRAWDLIARRWWRWIKLKLRTHVTRRA